MSSAMLLAALNHLPFTQLVQLVSHTVTSGAVDQMYVLLILPIQPQLALTELQIQQTAH